jgi:hypothetical protein
VRRAKKVRTEIESRLSGVTVRVVEQKGSGAFEVQRDTGDVMEPGTLYHSKLRGDGHLDCYPDKLARVIDAIKKDVS